MHMIRKALLVLDRAYLEVCIWFGVRIEYWMYRLAVFHSENLEELRRMWELR